MTGSAYTIGGALLGAGISEITRGNSYAPWFLTLGACAMVAGWALDFNTRES